MSAIFTLFYLYDPWLFHFFRMAFFVGIIALLLLGYRVYQQKITRGILLPVDSLVVIIALILLSFVPLLAHQTRDFSVVIQYSKTLILFVFAIGLYNLFYAPNNGQYSLGQQQFVRDLKWGISVQSAIGFLALCGIPWVIDFALSTNALLPRFYGSEQEYRLYTLTSAAFFQLSIFYVMLLHFLLAYNQRYNSMSSVFVFLLLFVGLISGRTFLLMSVISILLYFKWRYLPALFLFAAICVFLAMNYADNKYVQHALEPLINLLAHKGLASSSTDTLMQKHLYIPQLKQILFGDGYYTTAEGHYYGATDSGFIRQTLYGGILNVIMVFLFTAYFVRKIALNWFAGSWYFTLSTLFILSVLNIKADTYAFPGIMLVLLMLLSLFGSSGKHFILFKKEA